MATIEELEQKIIDKEKKITELEAKVIEMDRLMARLGADVLAFGDMIRQIAGLPKRGEEEVPQTKEEERAFGSNLKSVFRAFGLIFGKGK